MRADSIDRPLTAGIATGIGSLPHTDAEAAAQLVLRCTPELPSAPQLPRRSPHEQMIVQWLRGLPEVELRADGGYALPAGVGSAPVEAVFCGEAHGGLLTFLETAGAAVVAPARVKVQLTGPLTLGVALMKLGVAAAPAFRRAGELARAWAAALERLVREQLPDSALVVFVDEPALATFTGNDLPIDRDTATDLLSSVLATSGAVSGVHVCGTDDIRMALAAGPEVLSVACSPALVEHSTDIARFIDGGGFVAYGAVPTDRPIGEHAAPLWRALVGLWCELTRRGCDPVALRTQALVTPACGLATHGESQAERALCLAREIGDSVFDHAAATRLTVGA